jgi:putative endonuclease
MPAKADIQYSVMVLMSRERSYWVYILASRVGGTLYIGVTNDLVRRVYEHRSKFVPGFTRKYDVDRLVYYEQFSTAESAIEREKRLKKWNRQWKIRLIEESNPDWSDLYEGIAAGHIIDSLKY